jgi:thiosulfate/3-mercaptopyruvate sulfurtransferase
MLPPPEVFSLHMARLGISDRQRIVVYDGAGLFSAPRVWFTFKVFGVTDVYILDGGLPAWRAKGLPVENGNVVRAPGSFTPRFSPSMVADLDRVDLSLQQKTAQVIDARPAGRFRGDEAEPRAGVAAGHIPGSINVPSSELVKDGRLAAPDQIRKVLEEAGYDSSRPAIASCGSGVSAAIVWLALDAIGKPPVALYDGSWSEWGTNPSTPKATGPAKKS